MTQERCSYCDGDLRFGTVQEDIDHFRPKSRPEFYGLVCAWENLFLVCAPCNKAKGDRWNELLLKPDDLEYRFARYFSYSFEKDELEPNPVASAGDGERARVTIELLGLNGAKHRASRRRVREKILRGLSAEAREDLSYRFIAL
jgi:HNH endonuclease